MKKYSHLLLAVFAIGMITFVQSCKKTDKVSPPPELAHFTNLSFGTYMITGPTVVYKIPVGITTVSSEPRTINIAVTSSTGAVEGTHYTLNTKSLVIPAGSALDSITIQGVFSQYQSGRKDTLQIRLIEPGAKPSEYNNTFTLAMRGPCFEGEINADYATVLPGSYTMLETAYNATGTVAYSNAGPYTSVVKNVTRTSPTTVEITVTSIFGIAAWEAKFTLDHSDLTNRRVNTTSQRLGSGSAIGLAAYDIYVEPPSPTQNLPANGDFTFCQNMINLKFRIGARNPTTGVLAGYLTEGTGTATYVAALKR